MRKAVLLVLLALTFALAGCATVFSYSEYPVRVESSPTNLQIEIRDAKGNIVHRGQTPEVVTLDAHGGFLQQATYYVKLYRSGTVIGETVIRGGIDGWFFVNLLGGGVVGMLIDAATGAMWVLDEYVTVHADKADE